jgi:hypothetical protein
MINKTVLAIVIPILILTVITITVVTTYFFAEKFLKPQTANSRICNTPACVEYGIYFFFFFLCQYC